MADDLEKSLNEAETTSGLNMESEPLFQKTHDDKSGMSSTIKWLLGILILLVIATLLGLTIYYAIEADDNDNKNCAKTNANQKPKNLIILIGDGMGQVHNRALQLYLDTEEPTELDRHFKGRYATRSASSPVTDSAAGAFAFSCGNRTRNGYVGVNEFGNPQGNLAEAAKRKGMGVGIVTTTRVTHGTPAEFYGHVLIREWEKYMAKKMAEKNENGTQLDFIFGGGRRYFLSQDKSGSKRNDDWDFTETYKDYGWNSIVYNRSQLMNLTIDDLPSAGLFSSSHMPYYIDRYHAGNDTDWPDLIDMVAKGVHLLKRKYKKEGWMLMIEAGKIDRCAHDNDIPCVIYEMIETNEILQYLDAIAADSGDTLVIALADHETGGLSLGRSTSVQTEHLIKYQTGIAPKDYNISQYYGSFDYNYLMPPDDIHGIAYAYIYNWFPRPIDNARHSCEYIVEDILLEMNDEAPITLEDIIPVIEREYGIVTTPQEQKLLNDSLYRDPEFGHNNASNKYISKWAPVMMHSVAMIMNARTLTGFPTHGHTGADVGVSAFGPASDRFIGNFYNYEIGRMLADIMGLTEEQAIVTEELTEMYLNGSLVICDNTDPLDYYGWDENVSYPEGNLLYPGWCVEKYV